MARLTATPPGVIERPMPLDPVASTVPALLTLPLRLNEIPWLVPVMDALAPFDTSPPNANVTEPETWPVFSSRPAPPKLIPPPIEPRLSTTTPLVVETPAPSVPPVLTSVAWALRFRAEVTLCAPVIVQVAPDASVIVSKPVIAVPSPVSVPSLLAEPSSNESLVPAATTPPRNVPPGLTTRVPFGPR